MSELPFDKRLSHLTALASMVPKSQAVVEVGVFQGGSLPYLAAGSSNTYGVDAWGLKGSYLEDPYLAKFQSAEQAEWNMAHTQKLLDRYGVKATLIHQVSVIAAMGWDGPTIGLLHIDAHHTKSEVIFDFTAWRPHLSDDAFVVFDDYTDDFPEVRQAVDFLCEDQLVFIELWEGRMAVTQHDQQR